MNQWVKGGHAAASKIDPTIGAVVAAIIDILVQLDVHTQIGLSETALLEIGLHVAFLLLFLRSAQIHVTAKRQNDAASTISEPTKSAPENAEARSDAPVFEPPPAPESPDDA